MGQCDSVPLRCEPELIRLRRTLKEFDTIMSDWNIYAFHFLHVLMTCIILSTNISDFFVDVSEGMLGPTNTEFT
jgi:hypothetical protein